MGAEQYLGIAVLGEVSPDDNEALPYPTPPERLPEEPTVDTMFAASITPWLLNSALWRLDQIVGLKFEVKQGDLPSNAWFKLDTFWMGAIAPLWWAIMPPEPVVFT